LAKLVDRVAARFRRSVTDGDAANPDKMREQAKEAAEAEAETVNKTTEVKQATEEARVAAEEAKEPPAKQEAAAGAAEREPVEELRVPPEEKVQPAEKPLAEEKPPAEEKLPSGEDVAAQEKKTPSPEELARALLDAAAAAVRRRIAELRHRLREIHRQTRELKNLPPQDRAALEERARDIGRRLDGLEQDIGAAASADEVKGILDPEAARAETDIAALAEDVARAGAAPAAPTVPRPHLSHPRDKLPTGGKHPYRSGQPDLEVAPNPEGPGYLDADGNVWQVDRTKTQWHEWDVQHPDGTHTNVGVNGEVTHGPDNF
jgi:hypothetical protein